MSTRHDSDDRNDGGAGAAADPTASAAGVRSGGADSAKTAEVRVGVLRGAQVATVDPGRLRAVVGVACAVALAVAAIALIVAGAHRNAQVAALHDNGVRVTVAVTGCQGQLGGSGFNFVGYACTGTYARDGHQYKVVVPGSTFHPTGAKLTLVANAADPRLVATVQTARRSHPTTTVYVVPTAMLAAAGIGAAMTVRRRRHRRSSGTRQRVASPMLPAR